MNATPENVTPSFPQDDRNPNDVDALVSRGQTLANNGQLQLAVRHFIRATELDEGNSEAHYQAAMAHHDMGDTVDAIRYYRRALALAPQRAEIYGGLGTALWERQQPEAALACFQKAAELSPGDADVLNNLGNAFRFLGHNNEAAQCYQHALLQAPHKAEIWSNFGIVLMDLGQLADAVTCFKEATRRPPVSSGAWNHLGAALAAQGNATEAYAAFDKALQLTSDYLPALNNLGNHCRDLGQLAAAATLYKRALVKDPRYADGHNNLGNVLKDQGDIAGALSHYAEALTLRPEFPEAFSNLLFALNYSNKYSIAEIASRHREYEQRFTAAIAPVQRVAPQSLTNRRLRVGYVSPDLRAHPVGNFMRSILKHHDRERFEIVCYFNYATSDDISDELAALVDHWVPCLGMNDDELAQRIVTDRIDVLVDLAGHTAGNRLPVFARKPAPVQVTYLGYCNTTGMTSIDYRISDFFADPRGLTESHNSEQLVRLSNSYYCFSPPPQAPEVNSSPAATNGFVTFGCCTNLGKVTPKTIATWAAVLNAVPNSQLRVRASALGDETTQQRLLQELAEHGIAGERVTLLGWASYRQHLATYHDIDVMLDTYPFNLATNTCEALWMGVPVISLVGDRHPARMGLSILMAIGRSEWAAQSTERFVDIAVSLASDLEKLARVRAQLRAQMQGSSLLDGVGRARELEAEYLKMWQQKTIGKA